MIPSNTAISSRVRGDHPANNDWVTVNRANLREPSRMRHISPAIPSIRRADPLIIARAPEATPVSLPVGKNDLPGTVVD